MARDAAERSVALRALVRVEAGGAWSALALNGELSRVRLGMSDRKLASDLVRGTLRWQSALDVLLIRVLDRSLAELDVEVRQALRLGAYQLAILDMPPHAAVSTAVDAIGRHRGRGFVNGVLRTLARSGPPWEWGGDPVLLSFPMWMREVIPETTLRALQEPAPTHVRLRHGADRFELPRGAEPGAIVPGVYHLLYGNPGPLVERGVVTVQDEGSAAVSWAVASIAKEIGAPLVLDVCAGPGGKATHLAELLTGIPVLAAELYPVRAGLIRNSARRLNAEVLVVAADACNAPWHPLPERTVVLVDAPCTGLGTLRRRPEIRHRVTLEAVAALAAVQARIVDSVASWLPPGGVLVYSVCTVTREETEEVAYRLAATLEPYPLPALALAAGPFERGRPGRGFLLPDVHDTDGMFIAAFAARFKK